MEIDQLYQKQSFFKNIQKFQNQKLIKIMSIISIFIFIIFICLILIIFNLKSKLNKYISKDSLCGNNLEKVNNNIKINYNQSDYILKTKYNNDIQFYKEILQLYKENITEFKIRGRQKIMDINGKQYNESNISTIQDKLNYLLIHEKPEYKSKIVDKILLHKYSKKILGKDICVPILKIYNSSEEINLDELPEKFVLKCNHGSAMNILCNNKSKLNLKFVKKKLDYWLKMNYGLRNFEYQYINIKRKIFAEKYLVDNINDYKFYCFNGVPKFVRVQKLLPDNSAKVNNYYNLDWTLNEIETGIDNHFVRRPDIIFDKPKHLDLMIKYAKKLSSKFVFVRVDFYEINDKVYLGEMTFSPSNMLFNNKDNNQSLYLGSLLDISKLKKNI